MTEKSPPRTDRVSGPQCPAAATTTQDEVKDSTNFKVKNFTSIVETNDNNNAAATVLNILIDENKSTRKSIALLNRNIYELLALLKDKKAKDRERRF